MDGFTKLPKKHLMVILAAAAVVILAASLDVLMQVKDLSRFEAWAAGNVASDFQGPEASAFDAYVASRIFVYFMRILVPVMLGIYAYFAYSKIRINRLFVLVWTLIVLSGALIFLTLEMNLQSVFYYVGALGYGVLFVTVLSLNEEVRSSKKM